MGRVTFLRSRGGTDAVTCLWTLDPATGEEHLVADPRTLNAGSEDDLPPEERARRERAREQAGGIVAYATDGAGDIAAFALSGRAYVADLTADGAPPRPLERPAPSSTPTGPDRRPHRVRQRRRAARPRPREGTTTTLAEPEATTVTYGLAEFVAAEEMNRMRGYWWSPDGRSLLLARVDDAPVHRWHIADPANPDREPTIVAYPAAGTPNAQVSLDVVGLDGTRVDVAWDAGRDEYLDARHVVLGRNCWSSCSRATSGRCACCRSTRPRARPRSCTRTPTAHWVEIVPGVPARTASGALLSITDDGDARRLLVDGEPVTPSTAGPRRARRRRRHRAVQRLRRPGLDRAVDLVRRGRAALPHPGARCARGAAGRRDPRREPAVARRRRHAHDGPPGGWDRAGDHLVRRTARVDAPDQPAPTGERALRTALLLPSWHDPGTPLPVLMDPYGGPHAQRVVAARGAHLTSQWFAEQGFAVVVVDGRGTPGRGPASSGRCGATWPRRSWTTRSTPCTPWPPTTRPRPDPRGHPRLVVRRLPRGAGRAAPPGRLPRGGRRSPGDRWTLYDTHYTERYLGRPDASRRVRADLAAPGRGEADPPAAAGARPGRRQRRRRPHAAAVVGAARRRAARSVLPLSGSPT